MTPKSLTPCRDSYGTMEAQTQDPMTAFSHDLLHSKGWDPSHMGQTFRDQGWV